MRAVLTINLTAFAQDSRVRLSRPALNPGACFSSLLINALMTLFFQNRALLSALKNCQADVLSPQLLYYVSGSLSASSWSAEAASRVLLTLSKPNFFLKLSNHPLLALNSLALAPSPSFCFKLSYNDFAFFESY